MTGGNVGALGVAAIARVTTVDLLREVLPRTDAEEAYRWLSERTFAEPLGEGITLHELVRKALRADLRLRHPEWERELRRRVADYFWSRASAGDLLLSIDLAHLVENPVDPLGLLVGGEHRPPHRRRPPGRPRGRSPSCSRAASTRAGGQFTEPLLRRGARPRRDRPRHRRRAVRLPGLRHAAATRRRSARRRPAARTLARRTRAGSAPTATRSSGTTRSTSPASRTCACRRCSAWRACCARGSTTRATRTCRSRPQMEAAQQFARGARRRSTSPELDVNVDGHRLECWLLDYGPRRAARLPARLGLQGARPEAAGLPRRPRRRRLRRRRSATRCATSACRTSLAASPLATGSTPGGARRVGPRADPGGRRAVVRRHAQRAPAARHPDPRLHRPGAEPRAGRGRAEREPLDLLPPAEGRRRARGGAPGGRARARPADRLKPAFSALGDYAVAATPSRRRPHRDPALGQPDARRGRSALPGLKLRPRRPLFRTRR